MSVEQKKTKGADEGASGKRENMEVASSSNVNKEYDTVKSVGEKIKKGASSMMPGDDDGMKKASKDMEKADINQQNYRKEEKPEGLSQSRSNRHLGRQNQADEQPDRRRPQNELKEARMQNSGLEQNEPDWSSHYKSAESQIRQTLKRGNTDLSSQLEKVYHGILINCLKQSEDEPHKMEKCWDQFSTKMKPVFKTLEQKSFDSAAELQKCFQSERSAKDCVRQGIDFGQKMINEASDAIKTYLA